MFFFKKKTAYEMRISDWSSDVCSSDLKKVNTTAYHPQTDGQTERNNRVFADSIAKHIEQTNMDWGNSLPFITAAYNSSMHASTLKTPYFLKIGRASCRERVCKYVKISVFAVTLKTKKKKITKQY